MKINFTESHNQIHFILQHGSPSKETIRFSVPQNGCKYQSLSRAKSIIAAKVQEVFSKEHAFQKLDVEYSPQRFQVKLITQQTAPLPFIQYQLKRILESAFKNVPQRVVVEAESEIDFLASLRGTKDKFLQPQVYEFFKRLTTPELKKLVKEIKRASICSATRYEEMLAIMKNGKMSTDPDWPYFALLAFAKGNLNVMEVAQVLLIFETMRASGSQKIALFSLNHEKNIEFLLTSLDGILSEENKETLRMHLKELPVSEATFTYIDTPQDSEDATTEDESARSKLLSFFDQIFNHDLLIAFPTQKTYRQLVISPRIAYEISKVKCGLHAMIPNPVLGYSRREDFADSTLRDVYIPCPKAQIPSDIHGIEACALSMYHHDIAYHYFIDSANPHREAWIELATVASHPTTLFSQETLDPAIESLLDRDLQFYLDPSLVDKLFYTKQKNSSTLFWSSFVTFISHVLHAKEEVAFILHLLKYIWNQREAWKQQYGIDYQDIFSLEALSLEEFESNKDYEILEARFPHPEKLQEGIELIRHCLQSLQQLPSSKTKRPSNLKGLKDQ